MSDLDTASWFALQVKPQHEDAVARQLSYKGQDVFLPKSAERKVWSDRKVNTCTPLFPGYVFCRLSQKSYSPVLSTPGVVRIVSFGGKPYPVSGEEMLYLRKFMDSGRQLFPVPYLIKGQRVRITNGPLCGISGIVDHTRKDKHIIISVDLVMRSIAVNVTPGEVEAIA